MKQTFVRGAIFRLALVGICAAIIESVKIPLSGIPGVELVTLFTALFGYCFGPVGILAAIVFCLIETLLHGIGSMFFWWIILYFSYYPLLAAIFVLLRKARVKNRAIIAAIAAFMTVWFSFLSVLLDAIFFSWGNQTTTFWAQFVARVITGYAWFIGQTAFNAVAFSLLFNRLSNLLIGIENKFFPVSKKSEKGLDKTDEI